MRPLLTGLACTLVATAAAADEMSDKLCPILSEIAAGYADAIPEAAQAQLVIAVGGAYDFDHDALMAVLDDADAATAAACPTERDAVLAATKKASLTEAMR